MSLLVIHGLALRLLGRHIVHGAENGALRGAHLTDGLRVVAGRGGDRGHLNESEIQELRAPVGRDHNVAGLQVAMDHARLVGRRERVGDLRAEAHHFARGHARGGNQARERAALHELHHDARLVAVIEDVVDGDDAGMAQRGGRAGFLREAGACLGAVGPGQKLERHGATELLVARFPHRAHTAFADLFEDGVLADARADHVSALRRQNTSVSGPIDHRPQLTKLPHISVCSGV